MEQNTDISLNITDSLDDLLILKFWKIIDTNDYCMLFENWNSKHVYTDEQKEQANKVWLELYDEYYENRRDGQSHNELNKDGKLKYLMIRLTVIETYLNLIKFIDEVGDMLSIDRIVELKTKALKGLYEKEPNLEVKINIFDNADMISTKCQKLIKSIQGQIDRLLDERPKIIEKAVKRVHNVYRQVAIVSVGAGIQINIQNVTVKEWLGYEEIYKEKIKAQSNGRK